MAHQAAAAFVTGCGCPADLSCSRHRPLTAPQHADTPHIARSGQRADGGGWPAWADDPFRSSRGMSSLHCRGANAAGWPINFACKSSGHCGRDGSRRDIPFRGLARWRPG
jgi:hypothetical protein